MADALEYIKTKWGLNLNQKSPIEIPNVGRDPGFARLTYCLGFTRGVEVGVERGLFSEALLRENPLLQLSCVDPWVGYRGYRDHVDSKKLQSFYEEASERLAKFNGRATLIRKFSTEAAKDFADGSLDVVYLDGNHNLQNVIADIAAWVKKIRPGGILAGHDFAKYALPNEIHVTQAVRAWTECWEIEPWFLLGTQAKVPGQARDTARSWMWVVQPRESRKRSRRPIKQ